MVKTYYRTNRIKNKSSYRTKRSKNKTSYRTKRSKNKTSYRTKRSKNKTSYRTKRKNKTYTKRNYIRGGGSLDASMDASMDLESSIESQEPSPKLEITISKENMVLLLNIFNLNLSYYAHKSPSVLLNKVWENISITENLLNDIIGYSKKDGSIWVKVNPGDYSPGSDASLIDISNCMVFSMNKDIIIAQLANNMPRNKSYRFLGFEYFSTGDFKQNKSFLEGVFKNTRAINLDVTIEDIGADKVIYFNFNIDGNKLEKIEFIRIKNVVTEKTKPCNARAGTGYQGICRGIEDERAQYVDCIANKGEAGVSAGHCCRLKNKGDSLGCGGIDSIYLNSVSGLAGTASATSLYTGNPILGAAAATASALAGAAGYYSSRSNFPVERRENETEKEYCCVD